jgi:hypothetical protein
VTLWRTFPTRQACQQWCDKEFVAMVRERATTMTRQELDDYWNLPAKARVSDLPDSALVGSRFPLYGRNAATGVWNATGGFTTAWDVPRETADGRWAAQCRDTNDPQGGPEPKWPSVAPLRLEEELTDG